ncbi:axoneme-associated protein mst101(1)-like [Macrobrachium nipponense]|uniref:axoneme-associated protein mst101(1)-like n=1 Tax=Macrobrachium nipponense TaxID=159736 RepID=UPI0030C81796
MASNTALEEAKIFTEARRALGLEGAKLINWVNDKLKEAAQERAAEREKEKEAQERREAAEREAHEKREAAEREAQEKREAAEREFQAAERRKERAHELAMAVQSATLAPPSPRAPCALSPPKHGRPH